MVLNDKGLSGECMHAKSGVLSDNPRKCVNTNNQYAGDLYNTTIAIILIAVRFIISHVEITSNNHIIVRTQGVCY